ncbi:MAG: dihydroorotate dehydrogenase-like protein [Spirochaetales bacterium]|nr:dihydroorotate dehydrogenase-like protein [Spirochaetales bacterium]
MADVSTTYLGLPLKNPLVAASGPLTSSLDSLKQLEDAGLGAVVLKSIFEEQIELNGFAALERAEGFLGHTEGYEFVKATSMEQQIDAYLALLEGAKRSLSIPVIASINCYRDGTWLDYARRFIAFGADAIELNYYVVGADPETEGRELEKQFLQLVRSARKAIDVPLSLKIGCSYSSLANMLRRFDEEEVDGVVLFNRFYAPDVDIELMKMTQTRMISGKDEYTLALRWIGLMSEEVRYDLIGATGIHCGDSVIKLLLAGAKAVQLCSVLLKEGVDSAKTILADLHGWMEKHGFEEIEAFRGKLAKTYKGDGSEWTRAQYLKTMLEAQGN